MLISVALDRWPIPLVVVLVLVLVVMLVVVLVAVLVLAVVAMARVAGAPEEQVLREAKP